MCFSYLHTCTHTHTHSQYCLCCLVTQAQLCPTFCDPWTVAHQTPLSMGFSRQECWILVWILLLSIILIFRLYLSILCNFLFLISIPLYAYTTIMVLSIYLMKVQALSSLELLQNTTMFGGIK